MSGFAEVLRGSRLMALPPSIKASSRSQNIYPLQPAIRTTPANQGVGDWGLKRPLPRLRTKNITISDIDTQEHQTPFDSSNKFTKVVERWQEMGIPLTNQIKNQNFAQNLTDGLAAVDRGKQGLHIQSMPRSESKRLISKARSKRDSFLAANKLSRDVTYSREEREKYKSRAQQYLGIVDSQAKSWVLQSNGGLGYHPSGALSLFNSPSGPKERQLTARVLSNIRGTTKVGLGGIAVDLKSELNYSADRLRQANIRDQRRAATIKVYPDNARFDLDGSIRLSVTTVRPNAFDDRNREQGGHEMFDRVLWPGDAPYSEDDMESPTSSSSVPRGIFDILRTSPVGSKRS